MEFIPILRNTAKEWDKVSHFCNPNSQLIIAGNQMETKI
uniref:Uncharacterized protein n=1 Tax=Rhizophora mucronata TaxID=61149 RepID=A0A2P2QMU6_RHIMU